MDDRTAAARAPEGMRWRALVAALVAALLVLVGVQAPASAASAGSTTGGVTLTVDYGGETYDGTAVVAPGQTYTARLQYSVPQLTPGGSAVVTVPEGVTVPAASLVVPSGNTVVDSLALNDDGDLVVTFKDPLDRTIDQGVIAFQFVFDEPETGTGYRDVTWTIDGEETTVTIIVKRPGDELRPPIENAQQKSAGRVDLNRFVSLDDDGEVVVSDDITGAVVPYTISIDAGAAREGVTIVDTLSDYLVYDRESFSAVLTTWDENGFNKTTAPFVLPEPVFDGQTFTITGIDLPAGSKLAIAYAAHVDADTLDALRDALQAEADKIPAGERGSYSVSLGNAAVIDGAERSARVSVGGTVAAAPSPGLGRAFAKQSSLTGQTQIALDENGELTAPLDVTYTFTANLTEFASFAGTPHELVRNVVVSDTLPDQIRWADDHFLTVTTGDLDLQRASSDVSAADFAGDAYVGFFQLSDDGKTLLINVGKDSTKSYVFAARAQITSVDGLRAVQQPGGQPQVETLYTVTNVAYFAFSDTRDPHRAPVDNTLFVPKAPGSVIDDPSEFAKSVDERVTVRPNESAQVTFAFDIAEGAVRDLAKSRIVDEINHDVFDVSDLDAIRSSIQGTYDWQGGITGADFDLAAKEDGELVITTSDSFGSGLPAWVDVSGALTKRLSFTIVVPTKAIEGKQTVDVSNTARVEGEDRDAYTWYSEAEGTATSYGDELEVEKTVYAGDGDWTKNLRVELDDEGGLTQDDFTYRVQLLPHGGYHGVRIIPLADALPAGTSFLGFVADDAVESGDVTDATTVDMGGNVQATWNAEANTVEISQKPGTTLPQGGVVYVNFRVHVDAFAEDEGITNVIGSASATITPSDGFPLLILKRDSERPSVSITDRDARFTITGPDGEVVTDEAYVVGGQLVVAGEDGSDRAVVIPAGPDGEVPSGRYTVTETKAPAGYELSGTEVVVTIDEDGSSDPVTFFNTPRPLYAIGDHVWIDADRDGLQGDDEDVLPDVTVELLDAATGDVVGTTKTDGRGRYLFDLLPAGEYRVRFILTEEQAATYTFTSANVGDARAGDSDADRSTGETGVIVLNDDNAALVGAADYSFGDVRALRGVDPTWDAGVVVKSYAIGDYVWIDADRDGLQGDEEQVLPGVLVELLGASGEVLATTETDAQGRYLFDGLEAGDYQVRFTLTEEQGAQYVFTRTDGGEVARDSDAARTEDDRVGLTVPVTLGDVNESLTTEYDVELSATEGVDPTWDAGVVERAYAIGDVVWIDENADGLQDGGEEPLSGVVVELLDEAGDVIRTTETGTDGRYLFDELAAGVYQVRFTLTEDQADRYAFTTRDADDDALDSDADPETGLTIVVVLGAENPNLTREYPFAEVRASEGIDPTWDAGVTRRPEPLEPTPTPTPGEPTPAPSEPTPTPGEPTPAPGEPTPTPTPGEPTPAPGEPTPAPGEPTPAPGEPTPAPGEPTPAPEETPAPGQVPTVDEPVAEDPSAVPDDPAETPDELNATGGSAGPIWIVSMLLLLVGAAVLIWRRRIAG